MGILLDVLAHEASFVGQLKPEIDIRQDLGVDLDACGDVIEVFLELGSGPKASMVPPTAILPQIPIGRHIFPDLRNIARRVELAVPEDDEAGVCVGGAQVLNRHGGAFLAVGPVEGQCLTVGSKAGATSLPVDVAEVAFTPVGELPKLIVNEIQLPVDITRRNISYFCNLLQ